MLKLISTYLFACFLPLYLADAADHHLDLPILVPVQVLKRNNVLKLTRREKKKRKRKNFQSVHETFLRSWCLTWSEVLNLLVEVHVCPCFLENCSFVHSWNKKWDSILSHKPLTGGARVFCFVSLSKRGFFWFVFCFYFLKTQLLSSWLSYVWADTGWIRSYTTLLFTWQWQKKAPEDVGGAHELSAPRELVSRSSCGTTKISVAVGLLLLTGSKSWVPGSLFFCAVV